MRQALLTRPAPVRRVGGNLPYSINGSEFYNNSGTITRKMKRKCIETEENTLHFAKFVIA
jgi:hypothetical protein